MKPAWKIFIWFHLLIFLGVFVCPRIILVAGDIFSIRRVPVICGTVSFHPLLCWQVLAGEVIYLGHYWPHWPPKYGFRIEYPLKLFFQFFSRTPCRK